LGLLQREVAQQLGVDEDSIYYWETNRHKPSLRIFLRLSNCWGYMPYDTSSMTLGERIVTMRRCIGLCREELAEQLGVDETTLRDWEHGKRRPIKRNLEKLDALFSFLPSLSNLGEPRRRPS